ncbi:MAG TPA: cyclic nucleotide-binding domain-containing protein [Xanthobacteraceae bacterium]|nr:cyclic nucleotide-binding domain-containing protein [Xanthobacteraceae bacterium]
MAKVAVVGGGAAGMGAAIALTKAGMLVSLFEAAPQLGGHCRGVSVSMWDRRTIRVDAGVSEFHPETFNSFRALLDELDLRYQPVNPDVSFMTVDRAAIWFSRDGEPCFPRQPSDTAQFVEDISRFNQTSVEVLDDATYSGWSAQRYLAEKGYSEDFRACYFDPRARAELSMPDGPPGEFPIRPLVSLWRMLGRVGPDTIRPMTVQGGMHTYCDAVERWLRARMATLFLSTRVASISRLGDSVRIRLIDRNNAGQTLTFDHVVVATSAAQVVSLLEDASQEEARAYAELESRRIRLVVHQDTQLLPADRATWGAYNYLSRDGNAAPSLSVYTNRLQNLPASVPDVFVTINPFVEPLPDKIIAEWLVSHPVVGNKADEALRRLDAMQGRRRTWFCGAYLREPFLHEQAYQNGCETASRLVTAVADESLKFESGVPVSVGGFDTFLREIALFRDLEATALSEVQLVARPFQVEAGTTLFRQGDRPDGFYLIKRGSIEVRRRVPGDALVTIATLGPGAVVGEMSVLDGVSRSTHAIAISPTFGYFISSEAFQMLRSDCRPAAFAVMNCFRREIAARTRRVIDSIVARVVASEAHMATPLDQGNGRWPTPIPAAAYSEDVLLRVPFFRNFRAEELRELVEPLKRFDFSSGQLVYAYGEPARNCLVVVRGALSLNFATPQGRSNFSLLGPGKIAGELALIDGGTQPLACVAREPTIAFEIDRMGFDLFRRGGSVVALRFFEAITGSAANLLRRASAHMARIDAGQPISDKSPGACELSPPVLEVD